MPKHVFLNLSTQGGPIPIDRGAVNAQIPQFAATVPYLIRMDRYKNKAGRIVVRFVHGPHQGTFVLSESFVYGVPTGLGINTLTMTNWLHDCCDF
jgi:hypothetical protein